MQLEHIEVLFLSSMALHGTASGITFIFILESEFQKTGQFGIGRKLLVLTASIWNYAVLILQLIQVVCNSWNF